MFELDLQATSITASGWANLNEAFQSPMPKLNESSVVINRDFSENAAVALFRGLKNKPMVRILTLQSLWVAFQLPVGDSLQSSL